MRSGDNKIPARDSSSRFTLLDLFILIGLGLVFFTLYNATLLSGSGYQVDTTKYHFIGKVLGISHPPGSPLYILINWLFAQIPVGELAWRINMMSAIFALLTLLICYSVFKYLSRSRMSALVAVLILGISRTFWQQSIIAEVYTLHLLLVIAATLFILKWRRNNQRKHLALSALCFGLSFGAHLSSAFFIPGYALLLFKNRLAVFRSVTNTAIIVAGALAGMSTYLYYAIRPMFNPVFVEYPIKSVTDFFTFISGGYFSTSMFSFSLDQLVKDRLPWVLNVLATNLGLITLIAGVIGLIILLIKRWQHGLYLTVPLFLSVFYAMGYDVHDADVFLLPALFSLCAGIALIFSTGIRFIRSESNAKFWTSVFAMSLLTTFIFAEHYHQFRINYVQLDLSRGQHIAQQSKQAIDVVTSPATVFTGRSYPMLLFGYNLWGLENRKGDNIELRPLNWRDCSEVDQNIRTLFNNRNIYLTLEYSTCLSSGDYVIESWDFSRTLTDYFNLAPDGRMFAIALNDEGTAGIKTREWDELIELGITPELKDKFRWSYVALLVKHDGKLVGLQKALKAGSEIILRKGEKIAPSCHLPFNVKLVSGGNISGKKVSIQIDGIEYSRENRGIQIATFDSSTGVQVDRKVFDTHRNTSLREYFFFKISNFQPYLHHPVQEITDISDILDLNEGYLSFALQPMKKRAATVQFYIVSNQFPLVANVSESRDFTDTEMKQITVEQLSDQMPSLRVPKNKNVYLLEFAEGVDKQNISLRFGKNARKVFGFITVLPER